MGNMLFTDTIDLLLVQFVFFFRRRQRSRDDSSMYTQNDLLYVYICMYISTYDAHT